MWTVVVPPAFAAVGAPERRGARTEEINWRKCTAEEIPTDESFRAQMECATVDVPVDYERPHGKTLSLFVSRRPATAPDALGPLFVNQGGPGVEAAIYAASLSAIPAFDRFDIIGMDPRGIGRSTPLECRVDVRKLPAAEVADPGQPKTDFEQKLDRFVKGCGTDSKLRFLGSNNVARDMDRIRELLRAPQVSYYGKSYGSDLGTAYLGLFPQHVRAAVLDGASDLTLDAVDFVTQQARASQRAFDRYLEHCRADECAWTRGDDPATAWDQLLQKLAAEPVRDEESGESVSDAQLRDFQHESWQADHATIDAAIDALVLEDDPSAFVSPPLDDEKARLTEAFLAVTCQDIPVNDTRGALDRLRDAVGEPNPDLVALLATCGAWPKPADPIQVTRLPDGAPVMVVSTRGDVPTPYESGVGLARALGVPVLTWEASSHTAYLFSQCVQQYANRLLVDLEPIPPEGVSCPDDGPSAMQPPESGEPDLAEL
jgi:pimeloyl-ACP methyl ester carboxylesterase